MREFHIASYGAAADGETVNTVSIQSAIDACHAAGGGRVVIDGGRYITGTLILRDNVELYIAAGSTLAASTNTDDYPESPTGYPDYEKCPRASAKCVIYAGKCENAAISGQGTIDCQGAAFIEKVTDAGGRTLYRRNTDRVPPRMLFFMSCRNVRLTDFTMLNMAGGWGCWINDCTDVRVRGIRMECPPDWPNSDGVHINCSEDVIVSDCTLHTGDDSVIIRSNSKTLSAPRACERIIVKGCTLSSHCNAVRIGWRGDGEIRDCVLSDLVITDSSNGIGIILPTGSNPTDVGPEAELIHNIRVSDVVIDRCYGYPIQITVAPGNCYRDFRDFGFSHIEAHSKRPPVVRGREDAVIHDIRFTDCHFAVSDAETTAPFMHVKGLSLTNVVLDLEK